MQNTKLYNLSSSNEKTKDICDRNELFSNIFNEYYKRIYNYTFYRVTLKQEAEDITSQIFEKVIDKIATYDKDKQSFEIWLFAVARNTINDYFRKMKRRKIISIERIFNMKSKEKSPYEIVETKDRNSELTRALNSLNDNERNLIAYKFGAQLRNTEIAGIIGISESNVGVKLHRIMKKLNKELDKEEQQYEQNN